MSTLEVNAIKSRTGTDITIESGASITGTASQFKITGGTAGQAIITDGSGGLSFGAVDALPSQSGQTGKFLKTDGSTASWDTVDHTHSHPDELPTQTSQSGKFLTTDGTDASWDTIDEFSVSIADAPPGSASTGALWWESDTGRLKIYYNDGSSSQWVDAFPVAEPGATDPAMGGDMTGTASNAQIAADAVGAAEIATNAVGITELNVTDGTTGQVLTTNGSGTLSFTTISADPTMGGDMTGTASNAQIAAGAVGSAEVASTFDISSKTVTLPAASVTAHVSYTGVKIVHKTSTFTMVASDFDDCGVLIIDNDTSSGAYTITLPAKEDWAGKIVICTHAIDTVGGNALTFMKHFSDGGTISMTSSAHANNSYQMLSTGTALVLMHTAWQTPGGP